MYSKFFVNWISKDEAKLDFVKVAKCVTKSRWFKGVTKVPKGGWRGGSEEIPKGGWRGGSEEIPKGGWRGGSEEIPKGGWRGGSDEIPAGGWRSRIKTDVYRTEDGDGYFEFGFEQVGDIVEIDILDMPNYGTREDNLHKTHRLPSDRGCYKICFADPAVCNDMYVAKKWAKQWSEHTWEYIKTGKEFPNV